MIQPAEQFSPPDVAEEVRSFYERYPYPRPIDSLDRYRQLWEDDSRRRAEYHLFWPFRPYRENLSILVAGCGTSQAARHAVRWPAAQVTGIDCSETSVRCTEELKRKHSVRNLQLHQLAIEQVGELGMSFDLIVCTGVLHHLADPDAGLKALRNVLNPDGAMHLMVYAPYGRAGIYLLQDFCRRIGVHATNSEIRELTVALNALPPGHPLETLLREAPDFRHEAALADALLHPQDRAYSVPQLFEFIATGGLTFSRWIRQAQYSHRCGAVSRIPQAARIARLSPPEQYAAIELFRGTMVRHSLVAYPADIAGGAEQIGFSGDDWLEYVPIRTADTICVEERLPAGAAAVLINQSHSYKDLFLPINPSEKLLFSAVDGKRKIVELVEATMPHSQKPNNLEATRSFFEKLWWHDQVVFDASASLASQADSPTRGWSGKDRPSDLLL
jgi:SAM-dependent methyltransferase